jgi:hypothetical protein
MIKTTGMAIMTKSEKNSIKKFIDRAKVRREIEERKSYYINKDTAVEDFRSIKLWYDPEHIALLRKGGEWTMGMMYANIRLWIDGIVIDNNEIKSYVFDVLTDKCNKWADENNVKPMERAPAPEAPEAPAEIKTPKSFSGAIGGIGRMFVGKKKQNLTKTRKINAR